MRPLNYSILKYYTTIEEASAEDVVEALKSEYGNFKALNVKSVVEALMTAEANGLLEETKFELDEIDEHLKVYYKVSEDGRDTINKYIPD